MKIFTARKQAAAAAVTAAAAERYLAAATRTTTRYADATYTLNTERMPVERLTTIMLWVPVATR